MPELHPEPRKSYLQQEVPSSIAKGLFHGHSAIAESKAYYLAYNSFLEMELNKNVPVASVRVVHNVVAPPSQST